MTGSRSVYVDGHLAARKGDRTTHQPHGELTSGSHSVLIGGECVGAAIGGGLTSRRVCERAAATRESKLEKQTYGNCGVESVRQIINLSRREPITEEQMLNDVIPNHEAASSVVDEHHGGSSAVDNVRTLTRYGIAARSQEMSFQQVVLAVAEGRGVITTHDVSILWGAGQRGRHAVLVAGLNYDQHGVLQSVTINDTGWGVCCMNITPSTFEQSLIVGEATVVTDHPIW